LCQNQYPDDLFRPRSSKGGVRPTSATVVDRLVVAAPSRSARPISMSSPWVSGPTENSAFGPHPKTPHSADPRGSRALSSGGSAAAVGGRHERPLASVATPAGSIRQPAALPVDSSAWNRPYGARLTLRPHRLSPARWDQNRTAHQDGDGTPPWPLRGDRGARPHSDFDLGCPKPGSRPPFGPPRTSKNGCPPGKARRPRRRELIGRWLTRRVVPPAVERAVGGLGKRPGRHHRPNSRCPRVPNWV